MSETTDSVGALLEQVGRYGLECGETQVLAPRQELVDAANRVRGEIGTLRARVAELEGERECFRHERDASLQREFATRQQLATTRAEERKVEAVFAKLVEEIHALPVPHVLLAPPEAAQAWHDGFKSAKEFFADTLARTVCALFPTLEPPHA